MIYADNNLSIAENLEILNEYLLKNFSNLNNNQKHKVINLLQNFFSGSGLVVFGGCYKTNRINLKSRDLYITVTFKKYKGTIKIIPDIHKTGIYGKLCDVNEWQIRANLNSREATIAKEKIQIQEVNEVLKKYNIDLDILDELKRLPDIMSFSKEALVEFYPEYVV